MILAKCNCKVHSPRYQWTRIRNKKYKVKLSGGQIREYVYTVRETQCQRCHNDRQIEYYKRKKGVDSIAPAS